MKYPQLVSMPSAVSDWLEEQLEARGIDSEVYTRYILSLLHAHTLDVIYPEEDQPFSQLKKDGGRNAASHKRVRRTGAWWRHADADAEQIKRSAAVECLMSAAEQNCEIESLVDELCEKLKEVNSKAEESSSDAQQDSKSNKEPARPRKISPKELAERYYAAFPPLNQKDANSYLTSNINLVVGKWPSPEKSLNSIELIAAKWSSSGSPKKAKRKPKRPSYDNMKSTSKPGQNRNRFGYKKAHCVRTLTREMADNQANWEFVYNNNNSYAINDQCLDSFVPTVSEALPEYINMDENDLPVQWMKSWMAEAEKSNQNTMENSLQRNTIKRPQFIPVYTSSIWSNEGSSREWSKDEQSNEKEEHWSPIEEEESAIREEYQRCLEGDDGGECAIKMEYERPCVEDVRVHVGGGQWSLDLDERSVQIGGRWSTRMDQQTEHVSQDAVDFGLVKPNDNKSGDDLLDFNMQNEANSLLENNNQREFTPSVFRSFHSLPPSIWSDHDVINMPFSENECLFDVQTISLMKINHHKECSAFGKYVRPAIRDNDSLLPLSGPYSRPFGRPLRGPNMPAKVVPASQVPEGELWESPLVLFRPIRTPLPPKKEPEEETTRRYQDGATFPVSGNLDKVDFKRTNSGTLFIETEFGESRKYLEYHWQPPSDNSLNISRSPESDGNGFKLKFWVSQNDKAIQTETQLEELLPFAEDFNEIKETAYKIMENMDFDGDAEDTKISSPEAVQEKQGKCEKCGGTKADDSKGILKFINREVDYLESENVLEIADMVWKDSDETCNFCEGNHQWPNFMQKFDINWDSETLKDIWEGAGMCRTTRPQNGKQHSPSIGTTSQLREEIQEDAERLLSDLSSVQQAYSDSSRFTEEAQFKTEVVATSDRKRRHSYMDSDREMWSFATRLQEDCLINLSTLPTRRSVTL